MLINFNIYNVQWNSTGLAVIGECVYIIIIFTEVLFQVVIKDAHADILISDILKQ